MTDETGKKIHPQRISLSLARIRKKKYNEKKKIIIKTREAKVYSPSR